MVRSNIMGGKTGSQETNQRSLEKLWIKIMYSGDSWDGEEMIRRY